MNYPLQALMQMGVVPAVNYPPDSRYYRYSTLQYTAPNGQAISYLARRFVPATRARPISPPSRSTSSDRATGWISSPRNIWAIRWSFG